jgi:hypothetical protein
MSEIENTFTENETVEKAGGEIVETIPESANADTKEDTSKKSYPTQTLLAIRVLIGGYVLYLAYGLFTSKDELTPLMWGAAIVFIVAGVALIVLSVKRFICGEYEGGKDEHHLR